MQPVKKQLKRYVNLCNSSEEYKQKLADLTRVAKSDQWKFAVSILWSIKNQMAIELIEDKKFTALSPEEKDRIQTVYANINEWINFLTNPIQWVGKHGLIQMSLHNLSKMRDKTKSEKGK